MDKKLMRTFRVGAVLLALGASAWAADNAADSRQAKITDQTGAVSQVSGLSVTNLDLRFGFDAADDRGRIVVTTENIEVAIPLRAISRIARTGGATWTVKYQTKDGEAEVSGGFALAVLAGNSDFGSFSLPLTRLERLEFPQPGVATDPARRSPVSDQDGRPRATNFDAVLSLTDGTQLQVTQLRRNQVYAQRVTDPMLLARPSFAIICTNYTDFRLLRGETLQTIPFENVKTAQFLPGDEVVVRANSGAEATMKVPRRDTETIEGFNGASGKGDFYVPMKFVRSVSFGEITK